MVAFARSDIIDEDERGFYHCTARCVRRAFLCGKDPLSGQDYGYRRDWILDRIKQLAGLFAVDVAWVAILHNHYHLILRNRPDLVQGNGSQERWSDEEVMRRAVAIFPRKFAAYCEGAGASRPDQLQQLMQDRQLVAEMRSRLCSISWFMRQLDQNIARRANKEDDVRGHFWQERFHSQPLPDETALLLCAVYVDLNEIRAGLADRPETSHYTSAAARIRGHKSRQRGSGRAILHDGWLSPISFVEDEPPECPVASSAGTMRASDLGVLDMSLGEYLKILDFSGRIDVRGKRGKIPARLPAILDRLGFTPEAWFECLDQFDEDFDTVATSTH